MGRERRAGTLRKIHSYDSRSQPSRASYCASPRPPILRCPRGMSVPGRVLVVDGDPHTLLSVCRTLLEAGYTPIVTSDPDQAIRLATVEEIDLGLLDFALLETRGGEFVKHVFEVVNVPVILLLDYDRDELIARALGTGAEDYIVKPFSPSELAARIRVLLRGWRALIRESSEERSFWDI